MFLNNLLDGLFKKKAGIVMTLQNSELFLRCWQVELDFRNLAVQKNVCRDDVKLKWGNKMLRNSFALPSGTSM